MEYTTIRWLIIAALIVVPLGMLAVCIVLGAAHLRSDYDVMRDDTAQMERLAEEAK